MEVAAFRAYQTTQAGQTLDAGVASPAPDSASFQDALGRALEQLAGLQTRADASLMQLAAGQPVELHQVMLAMEEASIGFQLALQVRSKILEAYQDVMRTQV
ncbi:MAG: flagellar hook-basal body complex protein FliE [Chloroflexi bacterium]|nr:flagellar hook-basal body complex protein FliE [Chloroflexota bacterium]